MKFSVLATFLGVGRDGTGRTNKQTNGQTDIGTDRLFSENIILDLITGDAADHIANEIMKSEGLKSEAAHKARLALMLGKAKFKDFKGVQQIYEDIKVFFPARDQTMHPSIF